ncbi:MAG: T9SS type A sorting domain-containing protein [Bacteroidales bacterium]|nr:T9SS type A sorting domain-containing protein [Bacteroidales bacterium]
MKRLLLTVAWCVLGLSLSAQSVQYEYWFDNQLDVRITDSLTTTSHLQIEASHLTTGFHTMFLLIGSDSTVRLESFMFYITPPTLPPDTYGTQYTYWFDNDHENSVTGTLTGERMLIDCNSLDYGFHTMTMLLGTGSTTRLESFMFYITPPTLPPDTYGTQYTYWFDDDHENSVTGTLTGEQMLIDCNSLDYGSHTLTMLLGTGTTARLESFMFYILPQRQIVESTELAYWYEGENVLHHVSPLGGVHLLDVPEMECGEQGKIYMMASDSLGNTSHIGTQEFVMMDSNCCLPPLFATADHVTESGARLHWDYNRPQTFTLVYDTVPINDPEVGHNRVTLTDTLYWFTNMPAGIICYYAIKSECGNRWTMGEWNTRCRTLTPLYAEACDSYTWQGITYTSCATVPEFVYATTGGCDSVTVMHITINHSTTAIETVSACDSYTWHGTSYTSSTNTPTFTSQNVSGCDSVTTLHLTISVSATTDEYVTACDSYTWQGTTYTASAIDSIATANAYGCDSIAILHLTINNSSTYTDVITACDSYTWHGTAYTASTNTPTYTSLNAVGCDSVTTLHLTINSSSVGTENITACDSYTWHGTAYTTSTTAPTYTTANAVGCDSTVMLHLTINNSSTYTDVVTACDSYTWHGTAYTASTNTPTYTSTNAAGCDSVTTLHLTVNLSTSGTETITACDTYTWHGTAYTASTNTPTYTSTNAAGCDSVTTLHLTVNLSTSGTETVTACDTYTWHGTAYTASTDTPTYQTTNAAGCDSTVTLHLTINSSTTGTETVTACDSYTWNGTLYIASTNTPTYTTTNTVGCDSVITLNLTINYSDSTIDNETACDTYVWIDGITYTASTDEPTVTVPNIHSCDSTITLHLTVNYSSHDTISDSAANSYEWNGEVYTESGEYIYEGQNEAGCDSVIVLKLTISHIGISTIDDLGNITLYPNPTTGKVTIEASNVAKVEVFDQNGRIVTTFHDSNTIDIRHLPTGAYALRVTLHNGTTIKRVIKQ